MSYAELQTDVIRARDSRETLLRAILNETDNTLVSVTTAIAGENKSPPGTNALMREVLLNLAGHFEDLNWQAYGCDDVLGPCAVFTTSKSSEVSKRICIDIEESMPAARLMDLDVYTPSGHQISRAQLGLEPRRCLICDEPACDCMRLQRHSSESIYAHTTKLLRNIPHV